MAEHEHGSMDTTEQEKAFKGLITGSIWVIAASVAILVFLAIVGT
ncbi:MAG: aa3-type cytochrome c oxidase subunit IV [Pseudomonadota bacterium]